MKKKPPMKPNAESVKAMKQARSGKGLKSFESIDDLMADLDKNSPDSLHPETDFGTCLPLTTDWAKRLEDLVGDVNVDLDADLPPDEDDSDIS